MRLEDRGIMSYSHNSTAASHVRSLNRSAELKKCLVGD
jgi:hypothetical protein